MKYIDHHDVDAGIAGRAAEAVTEDDAPFAVMEAAKIRGLSIFAVIICLS